MQWIVARDCIRIVFLDAAVGQMNEKIVDTVWAVGVFPGT